MCFCRSGGIASNGLNSAGKDAPVGRDDRIGGIRDVERDRPVIGIDDHLHRIADVVDVASSACGWAYGNQSLVV